MTSFPVSEKSIFPGFFGKTILPVLPGKVIFNPIQKKPVFHGLFFEMIEYHVFRVSVFLNAHNVI